jgi:hypothetical protein
MFGSKTPATINVGIAALVQQDARFGQVKLFDKLIITPIAISESGHIGNYKPGMTAQQARAAQSQATNPLNMVGAFKNMAQKYEDIPEELTVIHISDVNSIELLIDKKSGLGGAIAGGLLFGDGGAVVGAMMSKDKSKSIDLQIRTKDFNNPQVIVPLFRAESMMSATSSFAKMGKLIGNAAAGGAKERAREIQELMSQLDSLLQASQSTQTPGVVIQQSSDADELAKFKKLLDDGVISQDEFDAKKKQILGL